jgi:hypothetical protein
MAPGKPEQARRVGYFSSICHGRRRLASSSFPPIVEGSRWQHRFRRQYGSPDTKIGDRT